MDADFAAPPAELSQAAISLRPRILHITEAPLGGVLTYLQELVSAQASSAEIGGVTFLVPDINAVPLRSVAPADVEIRSYRHGARSVLPMLRLAVASYRVLRDTRPDIVHIHSTIAGGIVRLVLPFCPGRPKVLYCPHGWFFARAGSRVMGAFGAWTERLLAHAADQIICVSDDERQRAVDAGIPASKCLVVKNGVRDVEPPPSCAKTGRLTVLYVGRFDDQKGFDLYLQAMARLGDTARGIAVGKYIVSKEQRPEIPPNVTVVDWCSRDELHAMYGAADVVLVPSRSESFGLVAAEAMRAGVAVFASRVGGLPELVLDGVTGHLFEAGDVDAIVSLLRAVPRSTLADFGRRGRERFQEQFTASRMNAALIAQYRTMVQQNA